MNETEDDDLRLVAFLDGEMEEADRVEFEQRLAADPALRSRLERFQGSEAPLQDVFAAMLADAPTERLRARLASASAPRAHPAQRYALRWAAAAIFAALLFGAGFAVARLTPALTNSSESWRQAVAEYMTLYTTETLGAEASASNDDFAAMGDRVGVALDVKRLDLAGLSLRRGQVLQYQGAPLLQIGYLDGNALVAFCILRGSEVDAPVTTANFDGFAAASWAKAGHGYMVIGKLPQDRIAALARTLQSRI